MTLKPKKKGAIDSAESAKLKAVDRSGENVQMAQVHRKVQLSSENTKHVTVGEDMERQSKLATLE